jgi:hypothetical protein
VTLEINSDPPPLDVPSDPMSSTIKKTMSLEQLGAELNKLSKASEFKLPPELLE